MRTTTRAWNLPGFTCCRCAMKYRVLAATVWVAGAVVIYGVTVLLQRLDVYPS
ncbi:hypothetical protein ACFY2N_27180 [Streptomyces rubiginosohelvolus]|uniref:hypothetical protein n=1 Tax=Streptomyces rubiginosohelvolus TaxID=67362 RepID=UPI0036D072ED